jgi:hypothetical protein
MLTSALYPLRRRALSADMADLNPAPYRGDPLTPHTSEDSFKACTASLWLPY